MLVVEIHPVEKVVLEVLRHGPFRLKYLVVDALEDALVKPFLASKVVIDELLVGP